MKIRKNPETNRFQGFHSGGVGGIRTLGPLLTATRFPVVLVMTTSILLRVYGIVGVTATTIGIIPEFQKESTPFLKKVEFFLKAEKGEKRRGKLPRSKRRTRIGQFNRSAFSWCYFLICRSISRSRRSFSSAAWVSCSDFRCSRSSTWS